MAQGFLGTGVLIDFFHKAGAVWVSKDSMNVGHYADVNSSAQLLSEESWQSV